MRCRKGGGRKRKIAWRLKEKELKEVGRYTYLGYVLRANGDQGEHVRERMGKGARILGQVWGLGKRKFGKDRAKRLWLFDKLVWSVMSYGVEIWGWKCREEIERIQERYLRWVLGVSRRVAEARSNRDFKFIKGPGIPGYLKKGWSEERWSRVARFRLGDALKRGRY
ncbi:GSCOCG00011178001-RA-CDS [Cotesia congregata]|nr:GSCOCG00011178001-RA-CDS [Cotesia congregata]